MPHAAMDRRMFACGIAGLIVGLSRDCLAQLSNIDARSLPGLSLGPGIARPWKFLPSIVIMSAADDARLLATYEAIAFWNSLLANLGSSFRLGQVRYTVENIPQSEL